MESHHYLGYEQPVGEHLTADRNYIKEFSLGRSRELGKQYGAEYAEAFHYIPPGAAGADRDPRIDAYIKGHAISRYQQATGFVRCPVGPAGTSHRQIRREHCRQSLVLAVNRQRAGARARSAAPI